MWKTSGAGKRFPPCPSSSGRQWASLVLLGLVKVLPHIASGTSDAPAMGQVGYQEVGEGPEPPPIQQDPSPLHLPMVVQAAPIVS